MDKETKEEMIRSVPVWFHSIDLGDDVITPGQKTPEILKYELDGLKLPDLANKTVLDIGAWDGFYSFEAERRGASRVLALDHYIWSMDSAALSDYYLRHSDKPAAPTSYELIPGSWKPGLLPGKRGFDTAHYILNSNVEQLVGDFMAIDPVEVGSFDVVLFLGVLYHLKEPLTALKRLALFARELAVIETAAIHIPGLEHESLFEFYERGELGGDIGNWWSPNVTGLIKACRAAGFRRVELVAANPPLETFAQSQGEITRYRLTAHAWR